MIDRLVEAVGGWRGTERGTESDVNAFDFDREKNSLMSKRSELLGAALVHVFVDEPYNRTGFTLAGLSRELDEGDNMEGGGRKVEVRSGVDSSPSSSVPAAVAALAREALSSVDWASARGTHPAVGVVDHVAVHPLFSRRKRQGGGGGKGGGRGGGGEGKGAVDGDKAEGDDDDDDDDEAEAEASLVARRVAASLGELGVPTYLYGSAKTMGAKKNDNEDEDESRSGWTKLADVRRSLGYFGGGGKKNSPSSPSSSSSPFDRLPRPLPTPDSGPSSADPAKGAAAVGSVPWVVNVNVPLRTPETEGGEDACSSPSFSSTPSSSLAAAAAAVARAVSARRGVPASRGGYALPGVEALALPHSPGIVEVACNLTDGGVAPESVALAVEAAARGAGLVVAASKKKEKKKKKDDEKVEEDNDNKTVGSDWYVTGKTAAEVAEEAAEALGLEIVHGRKM